MFPTVTEPRPYFIIETSNTVRRSCAQRWRTLSQLTLVSLKMTRPNRSCSPSRPAVSDRRGSDGLAQCDDCDEWQLVQRRLTARDLFRNLMRKPRRSSLPLPTRTASQSSSDIPSAAIPTSIRDRIRRLTRRRGGSAIELRLDGPTNKDGSSSQDNSVPS